MTQIEKIKGCMVGKEKIHYSIIAAETGININSVRGIINQAVKKGVLFDRLGNGYYKLKVEG